MYDNSSIIFHKQLDNLFTNNLWIWKYYLKYIDNNINGLL